MTGFMSLVLATTRAPQASTIVVVTNSARLRRLSIQANTRSLAPLKR